MTKPYAMHIVVNASAEQKQEILDKGFSDDVWVSFLDENSMMPGADVYFDLCFEEKGAAFTVTDAPVVVNAVVTTCDKLPPNYIRINGWNGFLRRDMIEVVATDAQLANAKKIFDTLGWKYHFVPDVPGMIAARVIAMIVNEAYFGLGDGISTKAEIDTAMKLGTNYPYGPFEWSEKICLDKIFRLLKTLHESESRYAIAPALEKELLD